MDLKKTMLLVALGALTACEHQSVNGYYETMPSKSMDLSQSDKHHIRFLKKYHQLYCEADGAWFSFGDEKQLRKSLTELKSVPMVQKIVAELPEHISIGSTYFLRDDLSGGYSSDNGRVNVASQHISKEEQQRKKGKIITAEVLFHELFHANQNGRGLIVLNNASMEEIIVSQQDINRFMKKDLIAEEQEKLIKSDLGIMSSRYRENFKQENATYCFQRSLISCHGDLDKACHHMATQRLRYFLTNQDQEWTESYHKQAILMIEEVAKKGCLSQNGNKKAYDNMLAYYAKTYGLSPKEMQKIPATLDLVKEEKENG